ncbi:hypothetical protein SLEP1_g21447 [Rubroshorea leprosula]|uniref:Transposase (putative) gypsy type domain-containing protein n=1 Tax=Rubroshorea leprosula TaxID=152421 RepID=A0AAV5JEQ5_9ROSI|nr:hypothetical protein SLEP1_g21447 [Rubroshorea leprosula]
MIVPPELQDLPEILTSESSASSNARDNSDGHRDSPSSSSSLGNHEPEPENVGGIEQGVPVAGEWEDRVLPGRLSNIRKAPKDLPAGFKFRASLHHEVADCAPSISGYRRLEEMIQEYHIPRTILVRTGGQNERACSVSRTGWIPVYADHFDAGLRFPLPGLVFDLLADYKLALTQLTPNSIRFIVGFMLLCARLEVPAKAIVFRLLFQCRLCPNSGGARWYYLSGRDKSQLFKNGQQRPRCPSVGLAYTTRACKLSPAAATGHRPQKPAARAREAQKFSRSRSAGYPGAARRVWVCRRGKPVHKR